jgi:hypothetical protein
MYTATLGLRVEDKVVLRRSIRFAVLAELSPPSAAHADVGVDLGRWPQSDASGAIKLLKELGAGAVKVGVPMIGEPPPDRIETFRQLGRLMRDLRVGSVETVGVLLSPEAEQDPVAGLATHQMLRTDSEWRSRFSPVLSYFQGLLTSWQLGPERLELRGRQRWDPELVDSVRAHLQRYVNLPEIIVPRSVLDPDWPTGDPRSILVPVEVPARQLPEQLAFLTEENRPLRWLQLEMEQGAHLSRVSRLTDLARRFVLAKAVGPDRIFLRAPLEYSSTGGDDAWQPTESYVVMRTLFHYLSGTQAVGVIRGADDVVGVIFRGGERGCMVLWTWRDSPEGVPIELYLGDDPAVVDLWGRPQAVEARGRRTLIRATPTPVIVSKLETPLALLQSSFRVWPRSLQIHVVEPRPVLSFRNHFDQYLSGALSVSGPANWIVGPKSIEFSLEPGEVLEQVLDIRLPPREAATQQELRIKIALHTPVAAVLEFTAPLEVGLRDIFVRVTARWNGDTLIVEHVLDNRSEKTVSFLSACRAPRRAALEGQFLRIAPGRTALQRYVYRNARDLVGRQLSLRVEELRGRRKLNQRVKVPAQRLVNAAP